MRSKTLGLAASGFLAVGALAFGGSHHVLASGCTATGPYATVNGTPVNVGGPGENSGAPDRVGVCVAGSPGGLVEVGANPTGNGVIYNPVGGGAITNVGGVANVPGAYAVVDGNDTNPVVAGQSGGQGYIGVSNYETGAPNGGPGDAPCPGTSAGTDSNSGGSIGLDPLCTAGIESANGNINGTPIFLVAPVACGNVSGPDWDSTGRDGCWEP